MKKLALSELRERLRGEQDPRRLRSWVSRLRDDPRAGARSLEDACARRLFALREEKARLRRLFALRRRLARGGCFGVAGVDEVGMGPLAGPVIAAAVVLEDDAYLPGLNDSKLLTAAAREELDRGIRAQARCIGIGEVSPAEIDVLNIYHAGLEAMRRAVCALQQAPDHLLVDARRVPGVDTPQTALLRGDAIDGSIAAASVVAKVHRDALMRNLDARHSGYGFSRHMGYATAAHLEALRRLGPSPVHRRSFAPVAAAAMS